jgi:hypothetical protein
MHNTNRKATVIENSEMIARPSARIVNVLNDKPYLGPKRSYEGQAGRTRWLSNRLEGLDPIRELLRQHGGDPKQPKKAGKEGELSAPRQTYFFSRLAKRGSRSVKKRGPRNMMTENMADEQGVGHVLAGERFNPGGPGSLRYYL